MKKELFYLKGYVVEIIFTLGLMVLYAAVIWILML